MAGGSVGVKVASQLLFLGTCPNDCQRCVGIALSYSVEYSWQVEYSFACFKHAYEYEPGPKIGAVFRIRWRREEPSIDAVRNDRDSVITDPVPGGYISCCRHRRCNDSVRSLKHMCEVQIPDRHGKEICWAPHMIQVVYKPD